MSDDPVPLADALCILLHDLAGRRGMDEAIGACREHMEPDDVRLLDDAIERGRELSHG